MTLCFRSYWHNLSYETMESIVSRRSVIPSQFYVTPNMLLPELNYSPELLGTLSFDCKYLSEDLIFGKKQE